MCHPKPIPADLGAASQSPPGSQLAIAKHDHQQQAIEAQPPPKATPE
jgi:hypothetical protein